MRRLSRRIDLGSASSAQRRRRDEQDAKALFDRLGRMNF